MAMGRPFGTFKYDNVDDLTAGIEMYFADCRDRNAPYTLSGLAYALNISARTLANYGNNDIFATEVARAKARCQQYAHEAVYDKDKSRGAAFDLSANYDMSERQRIDLVASQGSASAEITDADLDARIAEQLKALQSAPELPDATDLPVPTGSDGP